MQEAPFTAGSLDQAQRDALSRGWRAQSHLLLRASWRPLVHGGEHPPLGVYLDHEGAVWLLYVIEFLPGQLRYPFYPATTEQTEEVLTSPHYRSSP